MKTKWPKVACRSFSHLRNGNHCAASKNSTLAILLLYMLHVCVCEARARTHILQCALDMCVSVWRARERTSYSVLWTCVCLCGARANAHLTVCSGHVCVCVARANAHLTVCSGQLLSRIDNRGELISKYRPNMGCD